MGTGNDIGKKGMEALAPAIAMMTKLADHDSEEEESSAEEDSTADDSDSYEPPCAQLRINIQHVQLP